MVVNAIAMWLMVAMHGDRSCAEFEIELQRRMIAQTVFADAVQVFTTCDHELS